MWTIRFAISILLAVSKSCTAESDSGAGQDGLYVLTCEKLYKVDLETSEKTIIAEEGGTAIDYDFEKGFLVLGDAEGNCLYKVDLDTGSKTSFIENGIERPFGVAVDWIRGNVYWTDAAKNTISVVSSDGKMKKVLLDSDLIEPRAITLDPLEGWLFWSILAGKIERLGMDGTHRSAIASGIVWTEGLAVDLDSKRIYWTDIGRREIVSSNYDGSNVNIFPKGIQFYPCTLDLFEDWIYWSDRFDFGHVYMAHKLTGENSRCVANKFPPSCTPTGIRFVHSAKQPKGRNYCEENAGCSHLCLPAPSVDSKKITCACPDGMVLTDDQKNCTADNPTARPESTDSYLTTACRRYDHPFMCMNRRCVRRSLLCDGKNDCGDHSDEKYCSVPTGTPTSSGEIETAGPIAHKTEIQASGAAGEIAGFTFGMLLGLIVVGYCV